VSHPPALHICLSVCLSPGGLSHARTHARMKACTHLSHDLLDGRPLRSADALQHIELRSLDIDLQQVNLLHLCAHRSVTACMCE
jgi:hypothetical protein